MVTEKQFCLSHYSTIKYISMYSAHTKTTRSDNIQIAYWFVWQIWQVPCLFVIVIQYTSPRTSDGPLFGEVDLSKQQIISIYMERGFISRKEIYDHINCKSYQHDWGNVSVLTRETIFTNFHMKQATLSLIPISILNGFSLKNIFYLYHYFCLTHLARWGCKELLSFCALYAPIVYQACNHCGSDIYKSQQASAIESPLGIVTQLLASPSKALMT